MLTDISTLILAAGRGIRFDPTGAQLKLLARLPDQRRVIRAVAEASAGLGGQTIVVCSADHQAQISEALSGLDVQTVACPDAGAGMGTSLKYGLNCTQPSLGWIVMLGDMPYVQSATIRSVADALRDGALLARPYLGEQPGHPVGISADMKDAFLTLPDDEGGARIFRKQAGQVSRIHCSDEGCVYDIDRPEDLYGAAKLAMRENESPSA